MSKSLHTFLVKAFTALATLLSGHLGDRSLYVGASDVAGCPRKAALGKIEPPQSRPIHEMLVMAIGHSIEDLFAKLLVAGGLKGFKREVEVAHPDFPWFKCHLDFFCKTKKEIRVLELKSTKGIPSEPYSTWEQQHNVQLGLVALNNPGETVNGGIIVVDRVCGHVGEFNGYKPDMAVFERLTMKAQAIWNAVQGNGPIPAPEPGLLCGYCPHRSDCPAHDTSKLKELPPHEATIAETYKKLSAEKKEIENRLDSLKNELLAFTGSKYRGIAGDIVVNVVTLSASDTVDSQKLKAKFPDIYAQVTKQRAGYTKLEVK